MKVCKLTIRTAGKETVSLERAVFVKDKGIEGDKNAKGGDRQISLLPESARREIEEGTLTGLCLPRFTENITYSGDHHFKPGERYLLGEAVIEISSVRKKCFPECQNIIKNKPCTLVKSVSYAKIIFGGDVKTNDEIQGFAGIVDGEE